MSNQHYIVFATFWVGYGGVCKAWNQGILVEVEHYLLLVFSLKIYFQTAIVSDSYIPFRIKLHKLDKTAREILLEKGTTSEYLKRKYSRYETGPEPEPLSNYMDVSNVMTDTLTNWRIRKYCQMCILFYMLPSVRYNHI